MVEVRFWGESEPKYFDVSENAAFPFDYQEKTEMFRVSIDSENYLMIPREAVMHICFVEK